MKLSHLRPPLPVVVLLLASCRGTCSRDVDRFFGILEMLLLLGAICVGVFALAFLAIMLWVVIKNFRAPSPVSAGFALVSGILVILSGLGTLVAVVADTTDPNDLAGAFAGAGIWVGFGALLLVSGVRGGRALKASPRAQTPPGQQRPPHDPQR